MAEIFFSNEFEKEMSRLKIRDEQDAEKGTPPELLEIVVLHHRNDKVDESARGLLLSHRAPEPDGYEVFIDWDLAWHYRVFAWIDRLGKIGDSSTDSGGTVKTLNSWFDLQVSSMSVEQGARTARMLLCWDALFVQSKDVADTSAARESNDWLAEFRGCLDDLATYEPNTADGGNTPALGMIVSRVAGTTLPLEGGWKISMAVLIAIAIGFSQSQLGAPMVWEAFGAAYTYHQLRSLWSEPLKDARWKPVLELSIAVIAFLIRNQHTMAIQFRGYGEAGLQRYLKCFEGLLKPEYGLEQKNLFDALAVFSVIVEMRNRDLLEGINGHPERRHSKSFIGTLDLRCDGVLPRDSTGESAAEASPQPGDNKQLGAKYSLKEFLDRLLPFSVLLPSNLPREGRETWSLNFPLNISREQLDKFKKLVKENNPAKGNNKVNKKAGSYGPTLYALDRNLLREIREVFEYCIERAVSEGKSKDVFNALFKIEPISIPSLPALSPQESSKNIANADGESSGETAFEVRLRSRITAHALMFPRQRPQSPGRVTGFDSESWKDFVDNRVNKVNKEKYRKESIGADKLLEELFQTSQKWLNLKEDALEEGHTYIPFPLIARLLDVIARLNKPECASVEIYFDDEEPVFIYFPGAVSPASDLGRTICNYIHSVILNRAMTKGYIHCDLSYSGLDENNPVAGINDARGGSKDSREEARKKWRGHVRAWKQELDTAYKENAYWIYSDKYVRDYHNWRRSVELPDLEGFLDSLPSIEKTQRLFEILTRKDAMAKNELSLKRVVLLGIDIGATLIKFQFYRCERDGDKTTFHQASEILSISTPKPKPDQDLPAKTDATNMTRHERAEHLEEMAKVFAEKIVSAIVRMAYHDKNLYSMFQEGIEKFGPAVLAAVGIAWPGAVRANRIVGTSKILEDFPPLQRSIEDNRIEDLLSLEIAGALKKAFEAAPLFCGRVSNEGQKTQELIQRLSAPVVMLFNDGLAEGIGRSALLSDQGIELGGDAMVVLKVGSGLATSAFSYGRPEPGIWEGGKIALDLGARTNRRWLVGDASSSVSKRFMPEYIQTVHRRLSISLDRVEEEKCADLFELDRLDSQEIGTFLGTPYPKSITPMATEFGLRDLAFYKDIDVQILRRVREKGGSSDPGWQTRVARLIGMAGNAGFEEFRNRVKEDGCTRISEVLHVSPESVKSILRDLEDFPNHYLENLGENEDAVADARKAITVFANKLAKPSAEALGRRLGDLVVTLRDLNGVERVLITGGVLSGETRIPVIDSAKMRLRFYGLTLVEGSGNLYKIKEVEPAHAKERRSDASGEDAPEHHPTSDSATHEVDSGPYGAAMAALGAFLMEQQRKGYERISALIHGLEANRKIILSKDKEGGDLVKTDDKSEEYDPILLFRYALTFDEAREHIEKNAVELQVYLSATDDNSTTYVRWPYS